MYKYLFIMGLLLLGLWQFNQKEKPEMAPLTQKSMEIRRAPAERPPLPSKEVVSKLRGPAVSERTPIRPVKEKKIVEEFLSEKHPALPMGFELATNVFGVKAQDYAASMGDLIFENKHFAFVRSDARPAAASLVAVDKTSNTFYPIGAVLKMENIDESTRQDLIQKGLVEHYYHEALKIMYVQSSPSEVLHLYEDLQELKLEPQLELMKGFYQAK